MLSDVLMTETKLILTNLRIAGCAISTKVVISVGNGVLACKCPERLAINGGSITLWIKWARNLLKSMNWSRRKGTTGKRTMNPSLYEELCFTWKKKIDELVFENKMHRSLVLNFCQTPLGFTSPSKVTFTEKNSQNVPIANIDDKHTITGTFTVSLDDQFLPIQLIYTGKSDKCHPRIKFPDGFGITHSPNHWSNEEAVISHLTKVVFPYIQRKRKDTIQRLF